MSDQPAATVDLTVDLTWHRALALDELPEGRVTTVTLGQRVLALTHYQGQYGALDNRCPHQGGPLGWGSIENGLLRCPWHGYDYDPISGAPPPPFSDCPASHPVDVRADGVYVGLPPLPAHERTVSDVMVETMINWGVRSVFGMVGSSNLGFADAMRLQVEAGNLQYIGIRHEGAAAFAASAYAKLTGRPAACFAIAGPGATNLLTGLWDARMDRAPVLALTGQVDSQVLGPGAFQEIDLSSAFEAVRAWGQTVLPQSRHAELMSLAVTNAILQRAVAHLILPNEVQGLPAGDDATAGGPEGRVASQEIAPPAEALAAANARLQRARRPLIVVGYGARFDMPDVLALAERLNAPVITTFKGMGLVADVHPLGGDVVGHSGTPVASWLMNEADLLLVFGASFSNHTGLSPYQPTIQVDRDPMAIGKTHPIAVGVVGDVGVTARALREALPAGHAPDDQRPQVAERRAIWQAEKAGRREDDRGEGVPGAALFDSLTRLTPDDAVIAVDVGNNTYSFGRYFECSRQSLLMSGYLGSIGFALPAAIGAWAAAPDQPIVAVAGDGGFGQYMAELTTAVKYGMNITVVLVNNGELGRISSEQREERQLVWATDLYNPDFARYAENCGALGVRVTERAQLDDAIGRALAHPGPALVDVVSDPKLV